MNRGLESAFAPCGDVPPVMSKTPLDTRTSVSIPLANPTPTEPPWMP